MHRSVGLSSIPKPSDISDAEARRTKISIHESGVGHVKDQATDATLVRGRADYRSLRGINDFYVFCPAKIDAKPVEARHLKKTCVIIELPNEFDDSQHALINKLALANKMVEDTYVAEYCRNYHKVVKLELPAFDVYWSHEIRAGYKRKGLSAWIYYEDPSPRRKQTRDDV